MEKNKIVVRTKKYELDKPAQMSGMAIALKRYIIAENLYTNIVGKNYVHVEGWQYAGGLLGTYPRVVAIENLSTVQEMKWKAEVEIVNIKTKEIVGRGFAICSNKESKKRSFDEYAILSMAQTRAIGKAYRNMIGWVMKLAGYEATPKEEMAKLGETYEVAPTQAPVGPRPKTDPLYCVGIKGGCPTGEMITQQVHDYSKRMYGKALCRECQKSATPAKKK